MLVVLAVFSLVAMIIAAVRASEGKEWRYPATIRFIR